MFLPAILYVLTVQYAERCLKNRYTQVIGNAYIGDTVPLLDGSARLKDTISKNIDRYLQNNVLIPLGADIKVTVITKHGKVLYPPFFEEETVPLSSSDPIKIAADNYGLMNEGLVINVDLKLGHNTLLSNTILVCYILLSVSVLYIFYKAGVRKSRQEEKEKNQEIERLRDMEKFYSEKLSSLGEDREKLSTESEKIKHALEKEKVKASKAEEQMLEEIIRLEEKLKANLALQKEKTEELEELKEKIKQFEREERKEGKAKVREADTRRFKVLYKNISVHDRAVSGLMGLSDDLRIKAEEVIHQLNENSELVTIKRKVFGKKSKQTILEVIFAYKGRLYFTKTKDNKIEVLAVGSKNSQNKDLEFLDNLPPR